MLRPHSMYDLKTSQLRYDPRVVSNVLVAQAHTEGVLLYPEEGATLSLMVKVPNGWGRFTEAAQIAGVFDAKATEAGYFTQGRAMVLCLIASAFIAFTYQSAAGAWSLWVALIAVPAGAAIYQSCPACSGLEKTAFTFSPLLGILLVGLLWIVLSLFASRRAMWLAVVVGCFIWIGQMSLIASSPKFCLACLSLGFANCCLVSLAVARLDGVDIKPVSLPKIIRNMSYAGLGLVCALQSAYAGGYLTPHIAQAISLPQYIGRDIHAYVPSIGRVKPRILVVTREGCGFCDRAIAALNSREIMFQEVPVAVDDNRNSISFNAGNTPILTPLILVLNPDDTIGLAQSGWPSSSDGQTTLLDTLASVRSTK